MLKVEQARICYGGVAPKCLMATNTQAALEGQPWTQATLDVALLAVAKDVNITPDAPGAILPALLLHSASYSVLVQHSFCSVCQLRPAVLHCNLCFKSSLYSFALRCPASCAAEVLGGILLICLCSITKQHSEPAACVLPTTSVRGSSSRALAPDM